MKLAYLRYEILELFAYHKTLSKKIVENTLSQHRHITKTTRRSVGHHRREILEAFNHLRDEKLVIKVDFKYGPGVFPARGKPETHYKITEDGLKDLIANGNISGSQFWKVLSGYSSNNDDVLTLDKLHEFLIIFVWKNLKYRDHGFATYFDFFQAVCNNWFKERVLVSDRLSSFQKVLEVLAVYPQITLNNLVEKIGEDESKVNEILSLYSYRSRSFQDPGVLINDYGKENFDFIVENIIIVNQQGSDILTYELSLFGVMLTLLILLYNDMKKLKHGIYIKTYSFQKYCDKIAHNYSHKLPLVFGKWDHLRRTLKVSAIYNFDVVLLHAGLINNESNSLSVIMRGNEEIFQGIQKILQYNNSLMRDLVNEGYEVLKYYFLVHFGLSAQERLKDDTTFKKINPICVLLEEIMILLNPLWYRYPRLSLVTFTALDPNRILKHMEESFADEISACYYMNLLKPNIDVDEMKMRYERLPTKGSKDLRSDLEKRLSLLVQEVKGDPSTRDWVRKWSEDLSSVYQEIDDIVKTWSSSHIFW